MPDAVFFGKLFSDFVDLCGVFQRTDCKRCCEIIKAELLCKLCRFFKPEPIASKAPFAALFYVFKAFYGVVKIGRIEFSLDKVDFVFDRKR